MNGRETETGVETGVARVEPWVDILVLHCLHLRVRRVYRRVCCCRWCGWWLKLGRSGVLVSFGVLEKDAWGGCA